MVWLQVFSCFPLYCDNCMVPGFLILMEKVEQEDTCTIGAKTRDISVKIAALHLRANSTNMIS